MQHRSEGRARRSPKHLQLLSNKQRTEFTDLKQLPNVGPAIAADLQLIGVNQPCDLVGRDAFALYDALCDVTQQRHDPCVIDVFLSAVRFMEGGDAKPCWKFTVERKAILTSRDAIRKSKQ